MADVTYIVSCLIASHLMARIAPTELKTALAGAILEASFARFKILMAAFNAEIALAWFSYERTVGSKE